MVQVTDRYLKLGGLRFHYREWDGDGRPLVLLHGLASNCRIWDLVAPLLATSLKVYALDQRGHGESDSPDAGYDFDTVAEDLHAFLQMLDVGRPLLAGHSWGGNVALHYAASHPPMVSGLIFVDGGTIEVSRMPGMSWERAQRELAPPEFSQVTRDSLLQRVRERALGAIWSPEIEAAFLANFYISPSGEVTPRFARANHMQVVRALWEHKPSRLYAKVQCPVLIVPARRQPGNEREALFAEARDQGVSLAQDLLGQVRVHWMEDTIHDIPLHRPRELADAILEFAGGM